MKIELINNKIYLNNGNSNEEIHPFWLRERLDGEEFLDKGTQQRLFDPLVMVLLKLTSMMEQAQE